MFSSILPIEIIPLAKADVVTSISGSLSKNPVEVNEQFTVSISVSPLPPSGEVYHVIVDSRDPNANFRNEGTLSSDSNGNATFQTSLSTVGLWEIILTHPSETLDGEVFNSSTTTLNLVVNPAPIVEPPAIDLLLGSTSGVRGELQTFRATVQDHDLGIEFYYQWKLDETTFSESDPEVNRDSTGCDFEFTFGSEHALAAHTIQTRTYILVEGTATYSAWKAMSFLLIDNTQPTGSIIINGGASITESNAVILSLFATDDSGVVSEMRLSNLGGTGWTDYMPFSGTKDWTLTAGEGEKTVSVQFKDESDNESPIYSDSIYYDENQAPSPDSISGPTRGYINIEYTFSATASDPDEDQIAYKWSIEDTEGNITPYSLGVGVTSFSHMFNSGDELGRYHIILTVTDPEGLEGNSSIPFDLVENQPPVVSIISGPSSGYRGDSITITVTASEPDGEALTYQWAIDGDTSEYADTTGPSLFFVIGPWPSIVGSHVISVRAKDLYGAYSDWKEMNFEILNHPPTVSEISGPSSGYRGDSIIITATASDSEGDLLTYEWRIDNATVTDQTYEIFTYTIGFNPENVGSHTIFVRVKDEIGDYSDWISMSFTALNHPPTVESISGPTNGYRDQTYTFTATGQDHEGDTLTYEWQVDGVAKLGTASIFQMFDSGDAAGSHTIRVRAKDELDDYSTWYTITFDLLNPEPTPTPSPSPSPKPSPTPEPTAEPTPTPSPTASAEPTSTPSPTPSSSPTPTASPALTPKPEYAPEILPPETFFATGAIGIAIIIGIFIVTLFYKKK